MNITTFIYLGTKEIPQEPPIPSDGRKLHLVAYYIFIFKEESITKLTIKISSNIEHHLEYKYVTESYFESDNVVYDENLLPVLEKYVHDAYKEHYKIITESFKPYGLIGFKLLNSADFLSYINPLEIAIKEAEKNLKSN